MAALLGRKTDFLAFHAHFRPSADAVVDLASGERLTYRTLDRRVNDCAAAIVARVGSPAGQRIALLSRNSALSVIIASACERMGAIFTPLNWRLAPQELGRLLADCTPALLLAQEEFLDLAQTALADTIQAIELGRPSDVAGPSMPAPGNFRPAAGAMSAPAILLYTSGTSGRAKGVIITRENAIYSSLNFAFVASVGPASRLLCDSPMFHTVGLVAISRTTLMQGGCLFVSDRFEPSATLARLVDPAFAITHYFVVPQMVEALLREPGAAKADLSRLTALFSGGSPLSASLVRSCAERGVRLVNGYGMSEIGSAIHMPLDATYIAEHSDAVGFPAPFLEVRVADESGREAPPGEVGEIWARGPSVSPGYWGQPDATAASRSQGWFRTGDLARREPDGAFIIVDRLKDMYISGGENVYPAEVEAALKQIPGVADAAVIGVPDKRWGEAGCAFVQPTVRGGLSEGDVRRGCEGRLARFKQPTHIRFIDGIPRTGSGKALKTSLREAFLSAVDPTR